MPKTFFYKTLIPIIGTVVFLLQGCSSAGTPSSQPVKELSNSVPSTTTLETKVHTSTQSSNVTPTPELQSLFIYSRAVRALRTEEYNDAINGFTMVIKRMPELAIAYKGRAGAYYGSERIELAEEDLNKALDIDIDLGGAYLYLGLIHRDKGDKEEAKKNLVKAVNLIHKIRENWEFNKAQNALRALQTQ